MNSQLTLNFREGISSNHDSCREFVQECETKHRMQHKAIAAEMDLSPSTLSRKLAQSPNDSQKFTLDDLEKYIEKTGDTDPILWLVDKHFNDKCDRIAQLERELEQLKKSGNCA